MKKTIITKGLTLGSMIKLLFFGFLIPFFLFGIGVGIAAYMGVDTVMLNDQYVYGIPGLLTGIALGVFASAIASVLYGLIAFIGLWLWTRLSTVELTYKE